MQCGYQPVSFVTISCNMKDPSSHLGGLICWLAVGAGLSRLWWWKSSMFLCLTEIKTLRKGWSLWATLCWHLSGCNWRPFHLSPESKIKSLNAKCGSEEKKWFYLCGLLVTDTHFVHASSPPAVHFDLPLVFDPLSKSLLSAVAQLHSASLHLSLQILAWSHSVWASDSLFEAATWLALLKSEKNCL